MAISLPDAFATKSTPKVSSATNLHAGPLGIAAHSASLWLPPIIASYT